MHGELAVGTLYPLRYALSRAALRIDRPYSYSFGAGGGSARASQTD
jgi:hypothetical protein